MKKLTCSIFGHKYPSWHDYGHIEMRGCDGIHREHGVVYARCERCDKEFPILHVHIPKIKHHGLDAYEAAEAKVKNKF